MVNLDSCDKANDFHSFSSEEFGILLFKKKE